MAAKGLAFALGLAVLALPLPAHAVGVNDFQARVYTNAAGKKLPYRLFVPKDYSADRQYPLILFLHGAGERGSDNRIQVSQPERVVWADKTRQDKWPCFFVAPQCPSGQQWVDVPWSAGSGKIPAKPSASMALVMELLPTLVKEFRIDTRRLYITGLSMGGYGTWDLLARRPDWFAAAMPMSGGGDESIAPRICHIPIWNFHGGADTTVPVSRSRNMIAALQKAGGTPRYTEYKGVGHDCWGKANAEPELGPWLFSQVRAVGDLNGDAAVTSRDVVIALRCVAGLIAPADAPLWAGDLDGNGVIDTLDARRILEIAAGIAVP
jgi:predicted peptidase